MQIDHAQVALLAERLRTIGVGRRVFLKVVGALTGAAAVRGTTGWTTSAQAQGNVPAGAKLAKEQVFRWAIPNEPSSMDVNRYLYGGFGALIFPRWVKFRPDLQAKPRRARRRQKSSKKCVLRLFSSTGRKLATAES